MRLRTRTPLLTYLLMHRFFFFFSSGGERALRGPLPQHIYSQA